MKKILSIVLIFSGLTLFAQQDPQFTMNFANKLFNNPAYAGTKKICATGIFREQWAGFEGAPRDILFSVHSPIKIKKFEDMPLVNPGVGFTFINDIIGPISTNGFKLALSNHFRLTSIGTISLGVGVGAMGVTIDPSKFVTPDGGSAQNGSLIDPSINGNENAQGYGLDMDLGLYYRSNDERIFAGASLMHLTSSEFESGTLTPTIAGQPEQITRYKVRSHAYFMGGYTFFNFLGSADWDLIPSAFVKTEFITTQVDLNVRGVYQRRLWGGVSWRFQDAAAIMGGYNWANPFDTKGTAKFGFSYDINTSKLFNHNFGSFEIFVNYCFGISPKPKISIHKNPLWL